MECEGMKELFFKNMLVKNVLFHVLLIIIAVEPKWEPIRMHALCLHLTVLNGCDAKEEVLKTFASPQCVFSLHFQFGFS